MPMTVDKALPALLSTSAAAKILNKPVRTVRWLITQGRLPARVLEGSSDYALRAELVYALSETAAMKGRNIDHTLCGHPLTPAARAQCRAAHTGG